MPCDSARQLLLSAIADSLTAASLPFNLQPSSAHPTQLRIGWSVRSYTGEFVSGATHARTTVRPFDCSPTTPAIGLWSFERCSHQWLLALAVHH